MAGVINGKYLVGIMDTEFGSQEVAVCFDARVTHSTIGNRVFGEDYLAAGGFFRVRDGRVKAYGESVSTNTRSRGEIDAFLIEGVVNDCVPV